MSKSIYTTIEFLTKNTPSSLADEILVTIDRKDFITILRLIDTSEKSKFTRWRKVVRMFLKEIRQKREYTFFWLDRARIYRERGDYEEAKDCVGYFREHRLEYPITDPFNLLPK